MAATSSRKGTFSGASVFLSRNLVPPEVFDALHDALKLNGAQVFLCCDPSRAAPDVYHVISSLDHEKFADLRAKGCNLIGPRCVLSCAKERRALPKQGYTCCLAMDGVKVLASGFEKEEKVHIEQLVTSMGGILHNKASQDVNFVIVKNVLAAKYKWALNILKKPIVNVSWLKQCWTEHRVVPHEPHKILPFSGLTICVTRIPLDQRKEMEKLILQNGGHYSADLTKKCTHLISDAPEGDKYLVARKWGHIHIVTRRWVDQSIARRACLDEALYPVHGSSILCGDPKSSQKEQRYQEYSNATSQTVLPSNAEDPEATLSQNISSSVPDVIKLHNVSTSAHIIQMKNEKIQMEDGIKHANHIAEDSEPEDNDLYLSNCRIFLVGFQDAEQSNLITMIRKGGGSRHMLLSERLTHIIIGMPSEVEKKEVRSLAACGVINIVKASWLEECDQAKKELNVSIKHLASDLLFSKGTSNFSKETTADTAFNKLKGFTGIPQMPMAHVKEDQKQGADLFSERRIEERSENKTRNNFAGLATKSDINHEGNGVNETSCKQQTLSCTLDSQRNRSSSTFKGKTFCFSTSFPHDRRAQVVEWVREGGGAMLDDQQKMNAHFVIECHGLLQVSADCIQCTVVSTHWIRSCLEEACIQDIGSHVIYSPLRCHIPLIGFESLRFCVSQYEEKERLLLKNLCFTLGAKFTEKLTKKVTHLLCKFTNGPKYDAACKWGIQTITAEWINECISQDKVVALDAFRPRPVSAQDREAGMCIVSQYPTQAAVMISGCVPSQRPSESHGPNKNSPQSTGHCEEPEDPGSLCKRSRLPECESSGDAPKKKKISDNLVSTSDAGPDVADAIEDFIAQSSRIQDMKSVGISDSDRNMYTDHTAIGQNDERSYPAFRPPRTRTLPDVLSDAKSHDNSSAYDAFSETQTESQVVGYEEDLSGRQKIIDRVRSQSMTSTPDKCTS